MAVFKTKEEIRTLREAGRRLAFALREVSGKVAPGVTEKELDALARRLIEDKGDRPAFLGYQPKKAGTPYPATLCVSVNDEVVHSIPSSRALKEGDVVALDLGLIHEGVVVDAATTVGVGEIDDNAKRLLNVTEDALYAGISAARAGARLGDIGAAVYSAVEGSSFSVVRELGGHGVGRSQHEEPFVPNFGTKGEGMELSEGMVLAIEPIVNEGSGGIISSDDGYTLKTKDGKRSAHFEHTVLVTKEGAEIVSKVGSDPTK